MKKPLVIILVAFLVLALGGIAWLANSFLNSYSEDPATVEAVRQEILAVAVPQGLEAAHSLSFLGASLAIYHASEDPRRSLVLAAYPEKAIEDSGATWSAQTQIPWEEYDAEYKVEESNFEVEFLGATRTVSASTIAMKDGTYRAYTMDFPVGDAEQRAGKLFVSGSSADWSEEQFRAWLNTAPPPGDRN